MKCSKCGKEINKMNHHYVPAKNKKEGQRYCIKCAREEEIITLV
jgi:DNA-directed RNA polymerase subunit RPC12/RpoP